MRLLAYGGTSYVERRCIGQWPQILEGALSDTYSLTVDAPAYGVGLLGGEAEPFLIFRQIQNVQNRGGYAFTLLLDPGREVWERPHFAYNGAKLLLALLGEGSETREQFLTRPEELTESSLEAILKQLEPPALERAGKESQALVALWAGSVVASSPVVCSPRDVGFETRPKLEGVAAALELLPLPFRCGYGWLVGGSEEHSRAFGTRVTLDAVASPDSPVAASCIAEGRQILLDWRKVEKDEPDLIKVERLLPVWRWDLSPDYTTKQFIETIRDYVVSPQTPEEKEAYIKKVERLGFKENELKQAFKNKVYNMAVSDGAVSFTPQLTRYALKKHFEDKKLLLPDAGPRLDSKTLANELVARNKAPSFAVCRLHLSWPFRASVWRRLLTEVEPVETLPRRLKEALEDLQGDPPEKTDAEELKSLVSESFSRTIQKNRDLLPWLDWRSDKVLAPHVGELLRREAEQHALGKIGKSWSLEYVAFGQDAGGAGLARKGISPDLASTLVSSILKQMESESGRRAGVKLWLEQVASSPLRRLLLLTTKLETAKAVGGSWKWLRALSHLYQGKDAGVESMGVPPEGEREFLRSELDALVASETPKAPLNLRGLARLLGEVPREPLEKILRRKPAVTTQEEARSWLEGLRAVKLDDLYRAELLRLVKKEPRLVSQETLLDGLGNDEAGLEEMIEFFLTGGRTDASSAPAEDQSHYAYLAGLLRSLKSAGKNPDAALNVTFECIARAESSAGALTRRFKRVVEQGSDPTFLFEGLTPESRQRWFALAATAQEDWFSEYAFHLYERVLESALKPNLFERTVLEFLRSPEGEKIKREVETAYHGVFSGGEVDTNLKRILEDKEEESDDEAEDSAKAHEQPRGNSWAARLQLLLPAALHSRLFKNAEVSNAPPAQKPDAGEQGGETKPDDDAGGKEDPSVKDKAE